MSNKVACDFDGFDVLLEAIETVNHDIRPMVTENYGTRACTRNA